MTKKPFIFVFFITLFLFPIVSLGQEVSSQTTYATIKQGIKLSPDTFVPMLEKEYGTNLTDVKFPNSSRANTITSGLYKTTIEFTDSSKKTHTEKVSYLVLSEEPNLSFNNLSYNSKNKQIDISMNHSNSKVFMIADDKNYQVNLDQNGHFKGKYNPNKMPTELKFLAFEDNGNWSPTYTLNLNTQTIKETKEELTAITYHKLTTESEFLSQKGSQKRLATTITIIILLVVSSLTFIIYRYGLFKKQN
ncbi:hypothetical protein [Vagococcus fluvialis]|uniref:hypothetical protein n=1 Tax=Vagococcus fluvialis TaxID=2738 RepID=UPI0028918E89|nr:hypothetical protein [Vagococcus fluvialis]MDT2748004.1 hypothetical protein [Vagococcus fluvialis]